MTPGGHNIEGGTPNLRINQKESYEKSCSFAKLYLYPTYVVIQIFGVIFAAYGARAHQTVDTARFVFVIPGISKFLSLLSARAQWA